MHKMNIDHECDTRQTSNHSEFIKLNGKCAMQMFLKLMCSNTNVTQRLYIYHTSLVSANQPVSRTRRTLLFSSCECFLSHSRKLRMTNSKSMEKNMGCIIYLPCAMRPMLEVIHIECANIAVSFNYNTAIC